MANAIWAGRKAIYAMNGLAGEVDDHGCNRISQNLQKEIKELAKAHGLDGAKVLEIAKGAGGGTAGSAAGEAGAKGQKGTKGGKGAKRKVPEEGDGLEGSAVKKGRKTGAKTVKAEVQVKGEVRDELD